MHRNIKVKAMVAIPDDEPAPAIDLTAGELPSLA